MTAWLSETASDPIKSRDLEFGTKPRSSYGIRLLFPKAADGNAMEKREELTGGYIKAMSLRDRVGVATKFTFILSEGNPSAGGTGRKNIYRALEGSLRRL